MTSVPDHSAATPAEGAAPLYGLVLAGGESTRMGRPKWALEYRGRPHALALHGLLSSLCAKTFLSIREEQRTEPELARAPHITDRFLGVGPLGGILSAMTAHPDKAWLVVACDLPFLETGTLARLLQGRDPSRFGTSYRSPHDGMPEPLCAIYEPRALPRLLQSLRLGHRCPRKMLMNSPIVLIESPAPAELTNANAPDEYREALVRLAAGGAEHDV